MQTAVTVEATDQAETKGLFTMLVNQANHGMLELLKGFQSAKHFKLFTGCCQHLPQRVLEAPEHTTGQSDNA